jgi:hypothetical protein
MGHTKPPIMPWTAGDMAGPVFDFLTLAVPGSQVLLAKDWMTIQATLPCVSGAHGSMCDVYVVDDGWGGRLLVHLRSDRRGWIRHRIGVAE